MSPLAYNSYERYLIARQAVTYSAVNSLTPTQDQKITLIIIGVYTAAILVLWNMPIAKIVLSPFKVTRKERKKTLIMTLISISCLLLVYMNFRMLS
jgi:hypothetical protein